MIQRETILQVIDNTGINTALCIWLEKNKKQAKTGDIIKIVIKKLLRTKNNDNNQLKKGKKFHALIVRTKKKKTNQTELPNGIKFGKNAIILLNKKKEPIGSRIKGAIDFYTLKKKKRLKLLTLNINKIF